MRPTSFDRVFGSELCKSHKASYNYFWIRAALLGCALFVAFVIPIADGRKLSEIDRAPASRGFPSHSFSERNDCGLRCWLKTLTLAIPGKNFTAGIEPLRYTLSIPAFTCHGISLGGINSSYVPPLSINIDPFGIGTTCTTEWELWNSLSPTKKSTGDISATVADTAFANVTIMMIEAGDGLSSGAKCTACNAHAKVSTIKFSKDDAWFLNLFKGLVMDFLNSELPSLICAEGLSPLINNNVTSAIVALDELIRPFLSPIPPPVPPPVPAGSVNFTKNGLVGVVDFVVDTLMGVNGTLNINTVIDVLTGHTGQLVISNVSSMAAEASELLGVKIPTSFTTPIDNYGNVTVGLLQFNASGLDKWKGINILQPAGDYMLKSYTDMGDLDVNVSFFINVTIGSSGVISAGNLYEEATATLSISDATLNATMLLALNETLLKSFKPESELIDPNCLLWAVNKLNFTQTLFNMTVKQLGIFASNGDVEADLDAAVDNLLKMFVTSFNNAMPAFLTGMVQGPGRVALNSVVAKNIGGNNSCYANSSKSGPALFNVFSSELAFSGAGLIWLVLVAWCLGYTLYDCVLRRQLSQKIEVANAGLLQAGGPSYKTFIGEPPSSEAEMTSYDENCSPRKGLLGKYVFRSSSSGSIEDEEEEDMPLEGSLLLHPVIFWPVRILMPFFMLYGIALFISSNTSVGAQIYMKIIMDRFTETLPPLFDFSLANTVRDMWNAQVYPLSLMVACFSGAWPYIKLLIMLVCWVFPTWLLRPKIRETLLMIVDALGKWSLLDIYIMTMFIVAFHIQVEMPADPEAGTVKGDTTLNVYVGAEAGFYTFLLATVMSLILGHIAVYYHRKVMNAPRRRELNRIEKNLKSRALWGMNIRLFGVPVQFTKLGRLFIALLLVVSFGLSLTGLVITSFSFKFEGAAAAALKLIDEPTTQHYSVLTLAYSIPQSTEFPNGIGIRLIQTTFYIFAVVMPLIFLLVALLLWVVPLRPFLQRIFFVTTEICNAWAALDVFVVSIIAALLELPKFADFIVGHKCDLINELLVRYVPKGDLAVDTCFEVETTLESGCWVLFSATLLYLFAGTLVIWICHNVIEEREDQAAKACHHVKVLDLLDADVPDDATMIDVDAGILKRMRLCCGMSVALVLKYLWIVTVLDEEQASSEATALKEVLLSTQNSEESPRDKSPRSPMSFFRSLSL